MLDELPFTNKGKEDAGNKLTTLKVESDDKDAGSSFHSPKQSNSKSSTNFGFLGTLKDEDKPMIPTESTISLCPRQCWDKNFEGVESKKTTGNLNAISTSFLPCGVSIATSSTTDYLTIKTFGVVQLRVLFSRDSALVTEETKDEAKGSQGQWRSGGNTQVQVTDVNVPPPSSSAMFSPSDSYQNTSPSHNIQALSSSVTSLSTPWPCSKVEAMIMQRNSDFPCILSVETYSTSSVRSSASSTPAGKTRPRGKGRGF